MRDDVKQAHPDVMSQYELEKELARRLFNSTREDRTALKLYEKVYDEFFLRAPCAMQMREKADDSIRDAKAEKQLQFLSPFLSRDTVFLEIGAGSCALLAKVAKDVKHAFAIDVSRVVINKGLSIPNISCLISDGISVPVGQRSVTLAYSNQVLEHLHPCDAIEHMRNVHNTLQMDGMYICMTPNALSGPHDISMHFEKEAKGLHLREYTFYTLFKLMRQAGFARIRCIVLSSLFASPKLWPVWPFVLMELFLNVLPYGLRRRAARARLGPLSMNQIKMVGVRTQ